MSKSNQEMRSYRLTDADMLQASGVYHSLLQQDIAEFIAFDADFESFSLLSGLRQPDVPAQGADHCVAGEGR